MKVVQVVKPGSITVAERESPEFPDREEVIIRMKAVGICGSDIHVYHGKSAFASYPRVIGHELAGEVYAVGEDVKDLKPGDHVVIDPVISCGQCYACRIGRHNVCSNIKVLAAHIDGGCQEFFKIRQKNVHKIAPEIPWDFAATAEPYSIAAEALDRGRVMAGDKILICGAGPIGLVILQALQQYDVETIVTDIVPERLARAKTMGASKVIDSSTSDLCKEIQNFTNDEGVNLIFEATGNIALFEQCVSQLISPAGRIVVLGFPPQPAKIAPLDIMKRELEIHGSRLNRNKFPQVIGWLENGQVDPKMIITHHFHFHEVQRAFEIIEKAPEQVCKVILTFD